MIFVLCFSLILSSRDFCFVFFGLRDCFGLCFF